MKTRTGLKSGDALGGCSPVVDDSGTCKYMKCPFPPYETPCLGEETEIALPDRMREVQRKYLGRWDK